MDALLVAVVKIVLLPVWYVSCLHTVHIMLITIIMWWWLFWLVYRDILCTMLNIRVPEFGLDYVGSDNCLAWGMGDGRWDPAFAWKEDCYNSESYMHAASSSNESRLLLDSGRIEESPFATLMLLFFLSWVSTCDLKFWCSIGVSSQPPRVGWWSAAAAAALISASASASGRRRCIRTAIQYYHFRFAVLVPSFSPGVYILVLLSCRMPLAAAIPWLYNTPSWPRSIYMVLDTRERDKEGWRGGQELYQMR